MVAHRPLRRGIAVFLTVTSLVLGMVIAAPVRAVAMTFNVNTTGDAIDADVANPACATEEGLCSLRAAVMQANALETDGGHHTIKIPAGTYTLTLEGTGEYDALRGDLNLWQSMTIDGAGASKTIIQASATGVGSGIDRLFDMRGDNIDIAFSDLTLRRGNTASSGSVVIGGDPNNTLTFDRVVISNNRSGDDGAISSVGRLVIRDSTISNNDNPNGPAIEVWNGDLTIRRSTISGNTHNAGTIRYAGGGSGLIDRTTISGNTLVGGASGNAIQLGRSSDDTTSLELRNSTIAGNDGGGAMIGVRQSNTMKIRSSTIAGNTGYGIWPKDKTTVKNTIFSGNSLGNCDSPLPVSLGYNLDSGTTCGFDESGDIENGKARLGSLAFNGGPTRTRALGEDSDARDAGSGCPDIDQRGNSRPKDGDGNGTARCDIGAYEAARLVLPTPEPTLEPTAAPTEAPTEAPPTAAPPTEEPPTAAPTVAPAPTEPASTAAPGATEVPATGAPATADPGGATPAPTPQPTPAGSGDGGGAMIWIVIGILLLLLLLALFLGLRRRKPNPAQ